MLPDVVDDEATSTESYLAGEELPLTQGAAAARGADIACDYFGSIEIPKLRHDGRCRFIHWNL